MGRGQKILKLLWGCHQSLTGCQVNDHLPRVSPKSRLSANEMDDNEMEPVAVHISPGIYFMAEKIPGKHQQGYRLMKAVRLLIASHEVP